MASSPAAAAGSAETQEVVTRLLESTRSTLGGILAHFRVPHQDAEDLLQEVFLRYLFKRDGIRAPEQWLAGALRKECLLYWRRRRHPLRGTTEIPLAALVAGPDSSPAQDDLRRDLDRAMDGLKPRHREAIELRFRLGYDLAEVAQALGYRHASVDKTLRRGLASLRSRLVAAGWNVAGLERPARRQRPPRHARHQAGASARSTSATSSMSASPTTAAPGSNS